MLRPPSTAPVRTGATAAAALAADKRVAVFVAVLLLLVEVVVDELLVVTLHVQMLVEVEVYVVISVVVVLMPEKNAPSLYSGVKYVVKAMSASKDVNAGVHVPPHDKTVTSEQAVGSQVPVATQLLDTVE